MPIIAPTTQTIHPPIMPFRLCIYNHPPATLFDTPMKIKEPLWTIKTPTINIQQLIQMILQRLQRRSQVRRKERRVRGLQVKRKPQGLQKARKSRSLPAETPPVILQANSLNKEKTRVILMMAPRKKNRSRKRTISKRTSRTLTEIEAAQPNPN